MMKFDDKIKKLPSFVVQCTFISIFLTSFLNLKYYLVRSCKTMMIQKFLVAAVQCVGQLPLTITKALR